MSIAQAVAIEQIAYWRRQGLSREEMRVAMGLGPDDEVGLVRAIGEAWLACRERNVQVRPVTEPRAGSAGGVP